MKENRIGTCSVGSVVVKALCYWLDGSRIDPRWWNWGFFPWFPPNRALKSTQPLKMSTRDFSWGKGGWCLWLTTYHPCIAESRDDPGSSPTPNPLGHLGLSRDTFTLLDVFSWLPVGRSIGSQLNNTTRTNCCIYTGCPGENVPDFGRMFLKLKYTDITKNTYIRSWKVTDIKAREKCGLLAVPRIVPGSRDVLPVHCACPSLSTAGSSAFTLRLHM